MPLSTAHKTTLTAFGSAIRAQRRARHVTIAAAAEAAGMSRLTWRRIEIGEGGVAWRFALAAADSLGLTVQTVSKTNDGGSETIAPTLDGGWLPLSIRPNEFPGLQRLGWQTGIPHQTLTPREAWDLYERNIRHLDRRELTAPELALIAALERVYGGLDAGI